MILGSEAGMLPHPARRTSKRLGRLAPGKLFLVDLEKGRIVEDDEVKRAGRDAAALRRSGSTSNVVHFNDLPPREARPLGRAAARRCSWRSATRRRTCAS